VTAPRPERRGFEPPPLMTKLRLQASPARYGNVLGRVGVPAKPFHIASKSTLLCLGPVDIKGIPADSRM
jgi:hypothetical protein